MMTKYDIFVADAHIDSATSKCALAFIAFLDEIKGSTRTLYILGDLFDFWFGDNKASYTVFQPILDKFKELRKNSVEIVYIEGNHDFQMGRFFTDVLGAKVYPLDVVINIDAKVYYITHGDMIYGNKFQPISRMALRSLSLLKKTLPEKALLSIANWLSNSSRSRSAVKKVLNDALFLKYVNDKKERGISNIIFGHTHVPLIEERGGCLCVNPGAFKDDGSYARYSDGKFTLEKFTQR